MNLDSSGIEPKRTEPLITKAYNAFRQTTTKQGGVESFVPTEAYIDEQSKDTFRESTLSGLRHAAKLMETTNVQTGEVEADPYNSLPPIHDPKMSTMMQALN